ncbi:UDP-glucuronic acid decarboxylase 1, partial [Perkinsus olseni]
QKHLNGWEAKIPLKEGLEVTYRDFKKRAEEDESVKMRCIACIRRKLESSVADVLLLFHVVRDATVRRDFGACCWVGLATDEDRSANVFTLRVVVFATLSAADCSRS